MFHYHNCLPSDFKQVFPSVPPQAPTEDNGPQAFSCSFLQSKSTPPHCSIYSWSFAFWCRVYKGVIMTQLPSTMQCWQCNHLSANELSGACMGLSGPHSAKSGCYLCAFKPNTNNRVLHYPERGGHSFLWHSCPHTEIQIETTEVAGNISRQNAFVPCLQLKRAAHVL